MKRAAVALETNGAYGLNCRPEGAIRPGARAVFEMRGRVPATAEPHALFWCFPRANPTVGVGDDAQVIVTR
jgi:hypothetical protein